MSHPSQYYILLLSAQLAPLTVLQSTSISSDVAALFNTTHYILQRYIISLSIGI